MEEVADILNVTLPRAYELVRSNLLPAVKLGRQVRVNAERLQEWINEGGAALPGGWKNAL